MWWCFLLGGLFLFGITLPAFDNKYWPLSFIGWMVFSVILMLICKSIII